MIERLYLKNNLVFDEVDLSFENGLIVFTGASGAGKSVLFDAILGQFGLKDARGKMCECVVDDKIDLEEYGIEYDDFISFKYIQESKLRYFINNQSVSKKSITKIATSLIKFLSLKDYSDFDNNSLVGAIDDFIMTKEKGYLEKLTKLKEQYVELNSAQKELLKLIEDEQKIDELREFAKFEINKIEQISPEIGEYEKLIELKKDISKKDKILKAIDRANSLFDYEGHVSEALSLLNIDSSEFDDVMNELKVVFEDNIMRLNELDDENIEEILDRVEALSTLIKKYGSIEDTLDYLESKKKQLLKYENISTDKLKVEKKVQGLTKNIDILAQDISNIRGRYSKKFEDNMSKYIKKLHLNNFSIDIKQKELSSIGTDEIALSLNNASLKSISSGEFNRLRLALLAAKNEIISQSSGILILDEIDANLSGVESESVAEVLVELSKKYQIFSISHQPQLTAKATQHFVVKRDNDTSRVYEVKNQDRVDEIARIISGKEITNDAINFAKKLLLRE